MLLKAPSRLSTGVIQKSPRGGAFKEWALCGPGRPQSVRANTQRQGTVVFGIQKVRFWVQKYLLQPKKQSFLSPATLGG